MENYQKRNLSLSISRRKLLLRVLPAIVAVAPISMLFGVLASKYSLTMLDVFLLSSLGFSGSAQFAVLPLLNSDLGFLSILTITFFINSRYIPISISCSNKLPNTFFRRLFLSHSLGDEAYSIEKPGDSTADLIFIRFSIYFVWIFASIFGFYFSTYIPSNLTGESVNIAFPASVVLFYLSISKIKSQYKAINKAIILDISISLIIAILTIHFVGKHYFWLISITLISTWLFIRKKKWKKAI